jgi:two-component system KDP operon response regulator KdpE
VARILVIDDDPQIRRMLRRGLEGEGHEVLEARNGREGLRLHHAAHAEIVITDILMPDQDGVEVLLALRTEVPRPKVIAMSGGDRLGHVTSLESAAPLGAFATLRKPFELGTMLAAVRGALGK